MSFLTKRPSQIHLKEKLPKESSKHPFLHSTPFVKNPKRFPKASYIIFSFSSSLQDIHKKAPLTYLPALISNYFIRYSPVPFRLVAPLSPFHTTQSPSFELLLLLPPTTDLAKNTVK